MDALSVDDHPAARMVSVMAWMFFPRDEAKRHGFKDACLGRGVSQLLDEGFHKTVAPSDAVALFELARAAPGFDGLKDSGLRVIRRNRRVIRRNAKAEPRPRSILAGSIAADALLIPMICNLKYGRKDVGLHQAFRVLLGTKQTDDPSGLRNCQNVWKHYEPVSHLWAAWQMFDYPSMDDLDDFTAFVSLSKLIRTWGEQYKPLKANRPLLTGNVAVVPDDWVKPLRFDLILRDVDLVPETKAFLFGLSDG